MNNFNYYKATDGMGAIQKVASGRKVDFIAGGTNLLDLWKYDLTDFESLVDINALGELKSIGENENGGIVLGALVTNADTAYHPLVEKRYPILSKAILAGASAQIRNSATNGGNLLQRTRCHYFYDADLPCNKRVPGSGCPAIQGHNRMHAILGHSNSCIAVFPSDMCVALSVLDAVVHVSGAVGERSIPFGEFHRLPGTSPHLDNTLGKNELITGISLPKEGFADNYAYLKLRDRHSYAFALVSVATVLKMEGDRIQEIRISLGGVAHKPWRVKDAELYLRDKRPTEENFGYAATLILEGSKGFVHNDFKIDLAKRAIVRNCLMALKPESQRPGAQPSL
tara:strand:+ start:60811 stop:61830 length:1020 start_codon:yes stop_codon:yes gene_type:complete